MQHRECLANIGSHIDAVTCCLCEVHRWLLSGALPPCELFMSWSRTYWRLSLRAHRVFQQFYKTSLQKQPLDCFHTTEMPPKGRKPAARWSLHPKFHDDVAALLYEEGLDLDFLDVDDGESNIRSRDTNIMGRFICRNRRCHSGGWSSKKIAVTIRMYPGQQYNARVYHQRCKICNSVGRPVLDGSYVERVCYWIKRWNGIEVERPLSSGQSRGPHDRDRCEGCRAGHCRDLYDDLLLNLDG